MAQDLASLGLAIDSSQALSAAANLDRMTASAGKADKAAADLGTAAKAAGDGLKGVGAGANEAAVAHGKAAQAANENVKAHKDLVTSSGNARNAMMELGHVSRSLFDQLQSGQSVFRALQVESGRLFEIVGQVGLSGALGLVQGKLAETATRAVALANPLTAIGAAAAGAGVAFLAFQSQQDRLATSLDGIGRRAGATVSQLNAVAAAGAKAGGLSTSSATSAVAGFTREGITPDVSRSLLGDVRDYARATDTGTTDAAASLASLFRDPAKGAQQLDATFGLLDGRLKSNIENLEAQGRTDEARRVLETALHAALAQTTDTTWGFSKALESAGSFLSDRFHGLGEGVAAIFGGGDPSKRLASDQTALAGLQRSDPRLYADEIADLQREIADLQKKIGADDAKAAADKREADARALSLRADDITRATLPELGRRQGDANNLAVLRSALADPDHLGVLPGQAQRAYRNLAVRSSFGDDADIRSRQDAEVSLASINAFSTAERAAVEARRAELAVLRETGDLTRAQAASQRAVNEVIAKANSDADDRLTQAKQDHALVGLSPYERGLQQIKDRFEGDGGLFAKDAASKSDIASAMQPVAGDLRTAGNLIAQAMRDAAAAIRAPSQGWGVSIPGSAATLASTGFSGPNTATAAMINDAAARTGIPANVIAAVGAQENGGRLTGGTSLLGSNGKPSSAYGYGQITNAAAKDVANVLPGFDKYDPATAVLGSAEYLRIQTDRHGGDLRAGLNAYGGVPTYADSIARRVGGDTPLTIGRSPATVSPLASTSLGSDRNVEKLNVSDYNQQQIEGPLKAANQALLDQNRLFDAQQAAAGRGAAAIQAAGKAQALLNQYEDADPNHKLGAAAWDQITGGVNEYRAAAERAAKAQETLNDQIQSMDGVRSGFSQGLGTFVTDLEHGTSAGHAFRDVLSGIGQSFQKAGINAITNGLFGKQGTPGGGAVGGLFSSLFGGGGGAAGASGASGIGSFIGSLVGAFAEGGPISGPGTGTSDSIPARLSTGEYVVRASAASANRALLDQLNYGTPASMESNRRYASGGPVEPVANPGAMARSAMSEARAPVFQLGDTHIHVQAVGGAQFTDAQIAQMNKHISSGVEQGHHKTVRYITRNLAGIAGSHEQYQR